jgi:hypothetical protein
MHNGATAVYVCHVLVISGAGATASTRIADTLLLLTLIAARKVYVDTGFFHLYAVVSICLQRVEVRC